MRRKLHFLLSGFFILSSPLLLKAQVNYSANFNPNASADASALYPSMIASKGAKFSANLLNIYVSASNNRFSYDDISQLMNADAITVPLIDQYLGKLKPQDNRIDFSNQVQVLDFTFRIKSKKENHWFFQIGSRDRMEGNVQLPKNIFSLLLNGNEQWAGKDVNLGPFTANAIWFRENYITVSKRINLKTVTLYPSLRFKYLQGLANIYTQAGNVDLYTDPDGRYLQLGIDYKVNTAYPDNTKAAFLNSPGKGYAGDIGMGVAVGKHLLISGSVTDIGAIRFSGNTHQYYADTSYRYDGVPVTLDNSNNTDVGYSMDGYSNILNAKESSNSYRSPLPTRIALQVEYRLGKGKKKDVYRNHFYGSIIEGVKNMYGATTKPQAAIGYTHSFGRILSLGVNESLGGYYPNATGAFISFHPGPFHFEIGSNNLNYFFSRKTTYGAAGFFMMNLEFR